MTIGYRPDHQHSAHTGKEQLGSLGCYGRVFFDPMSGLLDSATWSRRQGMSHMSWPCPCPRDCPYSFLYNAMQLRRWNITPPERMIGTHWFNFTIYQTQGPKRAAVFVLLRPERMGKPVRPSQCRPQPSPYAWATILASSDSGTSPFLYMLCINTHVLRGGLSSNHLVSDTVWK